MPSKKDKLKQAARKQLSRATREGAGMPGLIRDIAEDRQSAEAEAAPAEAQAKPTDPVSAPATPAPASPAAQQAAAPSEKSPPDEQNLISEEVGAPDSGGGHFEMYVETDADAQTAESEGAEVSAAGNSTTNQHVPRREIETMARTRDSVYNVSSDIRLEDYTEGTSGGGSNIAKIVAGLALVLLVVWGVMKVWGMIVAPTYMLAIAGTEITDANLQSFASSTVVAPAAGQSRIHIRFQWQEGDLKTDLIRIRADSIQGSTFKEVSTYSRLPPVSVNYVYFMSQLEPGRYRIQVSDRDGKILGERNIRVR